MIIVRDDGPGCLFDNNVYCCHLFLSLTIDVPKWEEINIVSTRIVSAGGLLRILTKVSFS